MSYNLYILYDEIITGGGVCEGDENSSWPNYEDSDHDFRLVSAHHRQNSPENQLPFGRSHFELDFDPKDRCVYVVLVKYGDGDSFSRSHGNGQIQCVCKDVNEAYAIRDKIQNGKYKSERGYLPWQGYFNCLEEVQIVPLMVIE